MVLETDRLVLDQWRISDWMELHPIATDAEVMLYITGRVPWVADQIKFFVERQVKLYAERGTVDGNSSPSPPWKWWASAA